VARRAERFFKPSPSALTASGTSVLRHCDRPPRGHTVLGTHLGTHVAFYASPVRKRKGNDERRRVFKPPLSSDSTGKSLGFAMTDPRTLGTLAENSDHAGRADCPLCVVAAFWASQHSCRSRLRRRLRTTRGVPAAEPRPIASGGRSVYWHRHIGSPRHPLVTAKDLRRMLRSFDSVETRQRGSHLRIECGHCVTTGRIRPSTATRKM